MSANLRAFLYLIRHCEGTADANGYRRMFGGELFESFSDHPRKAITKSLGGKQLTSTAAGAYQFLSRTWDECVRALDLHDFGPESQDKAATYLISRRDALADVEAGRIDVAIRKCNREWASLPGSPYGQPVKSLAECLAVYRKAGGEFVPSPQEETVPLPAFVAAALPTLIEAVPNLIRIFGKGEQSERNAQAAQVVADIAKEATGKPTIEEATQAVQTDPSAREAFAQSVESRWFELSEAGGGGISGARDYSIKSAEVPLWKNPAMVISILLLPLVYYVAVVVLQIGEFSQETKAMVVAAIITGVLGGITGFFLGSSISSRAKDELIAKK